MRVEFPQVLCLHMPSRSVGKGKVVDVLTPRYDVVARFQGGPNAGHTLEFDGKKYVLPNWQVKVTCSPGCSE